MPLPGNLTTITLTGKFLDSTGAPLSGTLSFTPVPELVDPANAILYSAPVNATLDGTGAFSVTLICTDNANLLPVGWFYSVIENVRGTRTYPIYVPHSYGSTVDLSTVVPVPDLTGAPAVIPSGVVAPGYGGLAYNNTWTGTNTFNGAVTFASTVTGVVPAATTSVEGILQLAGDLGGTAAAPAVLKVKGVTFTGTPTAGQIPQATSAANATWTTLTATALGAETLLTPTGVKTTSYTAAPGDLVPVDTTSAAVTVTLPTAPADKTRIAVTLVTYGVGHSATIATGGADVFNKIGGPTTWTLTLPGHAVILQYSSIGLWYVVANELPLAALDNHYTTVFNVKAFGALGDGATDDTAAVQAAINACNTAGGGAVYFPAGTYMLTPTGSPALALNMSAMLGVRLVGDSEQGAVLKKTANGVLISISGTASDSTGATHAKYCGVENMRLHGNSKTGAILQLYYADDLEFRNLRISNNADVCVTGVELWDTRFYNMFTETCGSQTANASTPNVLLQCSAAASGFGSSTDSTNQVHFIGCRWEAFYTGAVWIQQGTGSSSGCSGIWLMNCKMETSTINGGPHLLVDTHSLNVNAMNLYVFSGGFNGAYATAQDAITWGSGQGALENVRIATGSTQTVANGVTLNPQANQNIYLRNVTGNYVGLPTGSHIAYGTGTGGVIAHNCTAAGVTFPTTLANVLSHLTAASTTTWLSSAVVGDTFRRFAMNAKGDMLFGNGSSTSNDCTFARINPGVLGVSLGSLAVSTAGSGLQVKEGSNAKQGTATLAAGSAVVANTSVTSTSRILLTSNADGGTPGWLRVSARTAGTSFTITSSSASDTSTVAYQIFEPA